MAQAENPQVPEEFFERDHISLNDIRAILPDGRSLPATAVLLKFSETCRRQGRTEARWKKLELWGKENRWGWEGCSSFQDIVRSGLLANLEDLLLSNFSDFGDDGVATLAESLNSGQLRSLRHLKLHNVGFLEKAVKSKINETGEGKAFGIVGAEALSAWLESDNARTVESLSIKGTGLWSRQALALLLKSFRRGEVKSLTELEFRCSGFDSNSVGASIEHPTSELAVVAELIESLKVGHVDTLRRLKLRSSTGYGISGLAYLAGCRQLGGLEYLEISGEQERASVWGRGAAMATALQANELQKLKVLKIYDEIEDDAAVALFSSMEAGKFSSLQTLDLNAARITETKSRAMAQWLRSGHASKLVELRYGIFDIRSRDTELMSEDTDPLALDQVIDACFSGKSKSLEYIHVPSTQLEEHKVLEWVGALEAGRLPLLKEFPCAGRFLSFKSVQRAILNAYKNNKDLTTTFWDGSSTTSDHESVVQKLEVQRQSNQQYMEPMSPQRPVPGTHGKVFLCGFPGVGKTTLLRSLQATWWSFFASKADHPRGIAVDHIRFAGKKAEDIKLAFWDSAGQKEFEALRNSFLPDVGLGDGPATFFIVVCSADASSESNRQTAEADLRHWLKFVSSSSPKLSNDGLRRRVLVVLNCFGGQQRGYNLIEWRDILADLQGIFKETLNIHSEPFILNAKNSKATQLRQLKDYLHSQARAILRQTQVPKIYGALLRSCLDWVAEEENRRFPVLSWKQYYASVAGWSLKEVKAATVHLHQTGHIVLFKTLQSSAESSARESSITDEAILVLDPGWLCERVIGSILLPDRLLKEGEETVSKYRNTDDSLRLACVPKSRFQISEENFEQAMGILVRLGLAYPVSSSFDNIFIPALIRNHAIPAWFTASDLGASYSWVMGFSLSPMDSLRTLLPNAVLHKLQVKLAEDDNIGGRADSVFRAGNSSISFRWEGLGFLVEFSGDSKNLQHNRLDILVKPLAAEQDDDTEESVRMVRRKQVQSAQIIVAKVLEVASDWPGLELKRSVVHPWMICDDFLPLERRDVDVSVEAMRNELRKEIENRITHGQDDEFWTTNWTVGGQLVKYEDVLGEGDWRPVADIFEKRCELTELVVEQLHVLIPPGLSPHEDENSTPRRSAGGASANEWAGSTDINHIILMRLWSEVRGGREENRRGFRDMHLRFNDIDDGIRRVTTRLHKVLRLQRTLNRHVQCLEMFTINEMHNSVPRFAYLTSERGGGAWKRLKDVVSREAFLHFWCEAGSGLSQMHEVEGQEGIEMRTLKDWAEKLAPILDLSLKVAFVAAKVAGSALLPGFGLVTPLLSSNVVQNGAMMTSGVGDLLQFLSETVSQRLSDTDWTMDNFKDKELRGAARAELKKLLDKLSQEEIKRKVGLRKVTILDNDRATGTVAWICDSCFDGYGSRVKEL